MRQPARRRYRTPRRERVLGASNAPVSRLRRPGRGLVFEGILGVVPRLLQIGYDLIGLSFVLGVLVSAELAE